MSDREPFRQRVDVRPRFRCLVCRRFVLGSEHGTCPQCGWRPPTVTAAPRRPAAARASWLVALALVLFLAVASMR